MLTAATHVWAGCTGGIWSEEVEIEPWDWNKIHIITIKLLSWCLSKKLVKQEICPQDLKCLTSSYQWCSTRGLCVWNGTHNVRPKKHEVLWNVHIYSLHTCQNLIRFPTESSWENIFALTLIVGHLQLNCRIPLKYNLQLWPCFRGRLVLVTPQILFLQHNPEHHLCWWQSEWLGTTPSKIKLLS